MSAATHAVARAVQSTGLTRGWQRRPLAKAWIGRMLGHIARDTNHAHDANTIANTNECVRAHVALDAHGDVNHTMASV